jgi:DNA-binding NtrC family response regulator
MMVLSDTIDVGDLPEYLRSPEYAQGGTSERTATITVPTTSEAGSAASMLENTERRLIADALAKASGNQSEAARFLRIGRDALRYKMKKYGLAASASS